MTTALTPARPGAGARTAFGALAARETRRFVLNPVFLFTVAFTASWTWIGRGTAVTDVTNVNAFPAIFLGGFGMSAAYWLTRSMHASEPVVGVTPLTSPARTAALCAVAIVPFGFGCLTLLAFLHFHPAGEPAYAMFSPSDRIAVLAGQIVVPALGGPLLGIMLGRWVRFRGAAFVLFLALYGWVSLVAVVSASDADTVPVAALRLFAAFTFFALHSDAGGVTAWSGSPWFFLCWQLALCVIVVLAALLRGAEGQVRTRIVLALTVTGAAAPVMLALTAAGGFTHPAGS
ncbi:hypothetical protein ACIRPX_28760 [Streptomyces sp. NPDC101225]|uniref:hypothetical protein n=1 Tax=Streptomyces sp. NPDC101225 TaxID=3366135 RepID=UPI0038288B9C